MERKNIAFLANRNKADIAKFCKDKLKSPLDFASPDFDEVLELARLQELPFIITFVDEQERTPIEIDKGGRPPNSKKTASDIQLKALRRELESGEYRKKVLCRCLSMSEKTFVLFLKDNPDFETKRLGNQAKNKEAKRQGLVIQKIQGLPQITMPFAQKLADANAFLEKSGVPKKSKK